MEVSNRFPPSKKPLLIYEEELDILEGAARRAREYCSNLYYAVAISINESNKTEEDEAIFRECWQMFTNALDKSREIRFRE